MPAETEPRPFLTKPEEFNDVSRGNPQPHKLKGDDLVKARLTPPTWRLSMRQVTRALPLVSLRPR